MIRFRVTIDEETSPGHPGAVLMAYRQEEPLGPDSPALPAFLRRYFAEPDVISSAAPHVDADDPELAESSDDASAADEEGAAVTGAPTSDGADAEAGENVWATGVMITTERAIGGFEGLPFCYEIVQPGRADSAGGSAEVRDPVIRVVAAPGVRVLLLPPRGDQPIVRVDVIRVQDPHVVPALGESLNASMLLTGNGVGLHRSGRALAYLDLYTSMHMARFAITDEQRRLEAEDLLRSALAPRRISVLPQRDGALFFDNIAERMLQVRVPSRARVWRGGDDRGDVEARFGYVINQQAGEGEVALTVAATAPVEVLQFNFGAFEAGEAIAPDIVEAQQRMQPFALRRLPDFDAVPLPGQSIEPLRAAAPTMIGAESRFRPWTSAEIPFVEPPPSLTESLSRAAADVMISLVPVVGDALDILELGTALVTGRDRWGQRVGFTDLAMMALGAITPFVNRREIQLALFVSQVSVGGAAILPQFLDEDEEVWGP